MRARAHKSVKICEEKNLKKLKFPFFLIKSLRLRNIKHHIYYKKI